MRSQALSLEHLLGLLADDHGRAEPNHDARNVAAAALVAGFSGSLDEFSVRRSLLLPNWQELEGRAREAAAGRLPIEGWVTEKPWLALCARVQEFGFGNEDVAAGHRLLFGMLVELVGRMPESSLRTLAVVAAGLRLLIERHHKDPGARPRKPIQSAWGLFEWIENNTQIALYIKSAWRKCAAAAASALQESDPMWRMSHVDEAPVQAPTPLGEVPGLGIDIWQIPLLEGDYEFNLPEDIERSCLYKSLTRVASLSRFSEASTLNATSQEMQSEVAALVSVAESNSSSSDECRWAVASLLSIATGTPLDAVRAVRWGDVCHPELDRFTYPGVLTADARWLIRDEYNPRESSTGAFQPRTVHIPLPPSLARLLVHQKQSNSLGSPVIVDLPGPNSRRQSIWTTTLFGALARTTTFGASIAQHVLGASYGLNDSPVYYDVIRADVIAHDVARITFPWFKDKACPPADGMPCHRIGSIRGKNPSEVRELMNSIRAQFVNGSPIQEQVSRMALHLLHGLVIAGAMRINRNMSSIALRQISLRCGFAILSDKPVHEQRNRLVSIPDQIVSGFRSYMRLLEVAVELLPGTALATHARLALKGEGPVFLRVKGDGNVHALTDNDYLESIPAEWRSTANWARHTTNQLLSDASSVYIRHAQMGWSSASAATTSGLATRSALDVIDELRPVIAALLRRVGWRPLTSEHGLAAIPDVNVRWASAWRTHAAAHQANVRDLSRRLEGRVVGLASESEEVVNAFLQSNNVPLQVMNGRLELEDGRTEPVLVPRRMHASLKIVLAKACHQGSHGVSAMLVSRWINDARERRLIHGPLPNRVVPSMPIEPGDFIMESPHALDHARVLWERATSSKLSDGTRVFLSTLLHGGVASSPLALACMDPTARLGDLDDGERDILVVQLPRLAAADPKRISGAFALDGRAAIALRAWHRSGESAVPDERLIRRELCALYENAFDISVGVGDVIEEIEAMVRASNSITAPGVIREVAMARTHPSFANLDRVVSLHKDDAISPLSVPSSAKRMLRDSPTRVSDASPIPSSYRALNKILRTAGLRDMKLGYVAQKEQVRTLASNQPPGTFMKAVLLFALALLDGGGLRKERLAISTIRDRVYSIGRGLLRAIPGKVALEHSATWEVAYLRMFHDADEATRPWLAGSIIYFHRILCREFGDTPTVHFGPLFAHIGHHEEIEHSGFLTGNELRAIVSCSELQKAQAEAVGNKSDIEVQRSGHILTLIASSTTLRPREYRALRVAGVIASKNCIRLAIRSRGDTPLKSLKARRIVKLRGSWASEAEQELASNLERRLKLGAGKSNIPLLQRVDQPGRAVETSELTGRLNELVRAVTGRSDDDCYLLRKTAALRLFRSAATARSNSPWPMIEVLAEMGHADPATLISHYIHDPVTLHLSSRPVTPGVTTTDASWILGMSEVSTRRLLNMGPASWLRRGEFECGEKTLQFEFPKAQLSGAFAPTPLEADIVARLICEGESVENAVMMAGWPRLAVDPMRAALRELEESYVCLTHEGSEKRMRIVPARTNQESRTYRDVLAERSCWIPLANAFEEWRRLVPVRSLEGIPMNEERWAELVEVTPHLEEGTWEATVIGLATVWRPRSSPGRQTEWPRWRWLLMVSWLWSRISNALSTPQDLVPRS